MHLLKNDTKRRGSFVEIVFSPSRTSVLVISSFYHSLWLWLFCLPFGFPIVQCPSVFMAPLFVKKNSSTIFSLKIIPFCISLVLWFLNQKSHFSVSLLVANFAAYSPIVQRPYGLGVAKTLQRGWWQRQACVLCWTSVYSLDPKDLGRGVCTQVNSHRKMCICRDLNPGWQIANTLLLS